MDEAERRRQPDGHRAAAQMTDKEIRLECLRLALARSGANDARPWRDIADEFHGWVDAGQAEEAPARRGRKKRESRPLGGSATDQ